MDTLTEAEQTLWRRLAVFRGPFSLRDARMVCEDEDRHDQVAAVLSRLLDQSLLKVEGQGEKAQYRLPETLRPEAWKQLRASREKAKLQRRLVYYLAVKVRHRRQNPRRAEWLDRLECEYDNLQAALRSWARSGETAMGMQVLLGLYWFWDERHRVEGRQWFERFLSLPNTAAPKKLRAEARHVAGDWALETGLAVRDEPAAARKEFAAADRFFEQELAVYREFGDRHEVSITLISRALVAYAERDLSTARILSEEAFEIDPGWGELLTVISDSDLEQLCQEVDDWMSSLLIEFLAFVKENDNQEKSE